MAGIREGGVVVARLVTPMSVISNRPVFASDTLSLKRRTGTQGGVQRWEIQTNVEPLVGSADLMVNMIVAGDSGIVEVEMPQLYRRSGGTNITAMVPTVAAVRGANSVQVTLTGTRVSKGEFIRFSNHTKVYMVTADRVGSGPLGLFPALTADIATTDSIFFGNTNVIMKARYDSSTVKGMIYTDGILQDPGQITLIEAI